MFYRLSFILSIPNMNADSKLDREFGSWVAGHACRRAAVVATCESKANFFSKLYRQSTQCSVVLLEKICIFHTCLEHIGCPKKKLRTECCWSPKLGGQLPNFLGHIVDTLQLLQWYIRRIVESDESLAPWQRNLEGNKLAKTNPLRAFVTGQCTIG